MAAPPEAQSPYALLEEVERARDVLVLTYTASLEFFERFALSDARALGALVTVVNDATMVRADPVVVRRAGVHYLDARAVCPGRKAFHPQAVRRRGRRAGAGRHRLGQSDDGRLARERRDVDGVARRR